MGKSVQMRLKILVLLVFMLAGCSVKKDVDKSKEISKDDTNIEQVKETATETKKTTEVNEEELQRRLMQEIISQLAINYNGEGENDKLILELKKTIDGLKFEVSGKGSANYKQDEQIDYSENFDRIHKRQDSLHAISQKDNYLLRQEIDRLIKSKQVTKEVRQVSFWWFLVIAVIFFVIGRFLRFKSFF